MNQNLQPIPKNLPRQATGPKGVPIERLIELRKKNLSYPEIAKIVNIHPKNVYIRLKPIIDDIDNTHLFRKHRTDILSYWQSKIIQSITRADLEKASLRDKIISASILYDKERLESGKSTQNIAYLDMIKASAKIKEDQQTIEAELVSAGVDLPVYNSDSDTVDKQENNVTP